MPSIIAVGTAVPEHRIDQEVARQFAAGFFGKSRTDTCRLLPVFENTTIRKRYFCVPMEWFASHHTFAEKSRIFVEKGAELAEQAVLLACSRAGVSPKEIGHVFFVSTTGIATPSIDAHLFNRVGFRPSILRTPIWGLGCAGGVAGLGRASDWLRAYPDQMAMAITLELCGLTFLADDHSRSNFIATSLFGEGCGAILIAGDQLMTPAGRSISIEASGAVTWPDTLGIMGWEVVENGLKVIFSRSIPDVVHSSAKGSIEEFLAKHGTTMGSISHFLSHPGGARVIAAYSEALGLEEHQVESMRHVLREFGNMSSATVFFVLDHFLTSGRYQPGDRVFSTALGPGFSTEMLLGRCLQ